MNFRVKDKIKFDQIEAALGSFDSAQFSLSGLTNDVRKSVLAAQVLDSVRRMGLGRDARTVTDWLTALH